MPETEDQRPPAPALVPPLGILGAVVLAAGVFAPAVTPPGGAWRSYYEVAPGDGNVLLGLAAAALALTWVFHWYRGLFVTGGAALLLMGATLLKVPRSGLAGASLSWGWLPLVAGAVLLLAAAVVAERARRREPERAAEDEPVEE
jgi:hypothetical protein